MWTGTSRIPGYVNKQKSFYKRKCVKSLMFAICMMLPSIDLRMLWLYNVLKVLFEKLCLQERCENKKLPKTINKQQQSTSEAAVSMHRHKHADTHRHTQIRHFHPLISFSLRKNSSEVSVFVMMNPESYTNTQTHTQSIAWHIIAF